MIADSIENAHLYYGLGEKFQKALEFLKDADFAELAEGKYDIDGEEVFALVQKYDTIDPDDGKWEKHEKYIDIQYIAIGSEDFGFVNEEYLEPLGAYDEKNDVQWLDGEGDFIQLHDGEFMILFPHDAHMPKLSIEESSEVLKVVVKVKA